MFLSYLYVCVLLPGKGRGIRRNQSPPFHLPRVLLPRDGGLCAHFLFLQPTGGPHPPALSGLLHAGLRGEHGAHPLLEHPSLHPGAGRLVPDASRGHRHGGVLSGYHVPDRILPVVPPEQDLHLPPTPADQALRALLRAVALPRDAAAHGAGGQRGEAGVWGSEGG